jgi:hypothetical protein
MIMLLFFDDKSLTQTVLNHCWEIITYKFYPK